MAKITWSDPVEWKRLPQQSPMRQASYEIPAAKGDTEPAELAVFYFGAGQGGDIDANVQRWVGQFKDVDDAAVRRENRTANGLSQHVIAIESGTYDAQMPMAKKGPQKNYGMLGAIVDAPSGRYFFKLVGPANTVKQAKKPFYEMLDGIKPGT